METMIKTQNRERKKREGKKEVENFVGGRRKIREGETLGLIGGKREGD